MYRLSDGIQSAKSSQHVLEICILGVNDGILACADSWRAIRDSGILLWLALVTLFNLRSQAWPYKSYDKVKTNEE